jgi:pSer/pThr/pTyr-binding forkhead associated (FHA) protein
MTPNPIQKLVRWLFGSPGMSDPTAGAVERRCEAGHWMDPSWIECPYCRAEKSVRVRTTGFKTRVERPADDPERPAGDKAAGERARRITGVLVTFSWRREGQLFPLYEGKNLIGSGSAADRRCDVQISTDPTLSREHALIRCLGDDCEIFDQKSENGTHMNDRRVPVHGMPLENGARIKTGATIWVFQMIRVPDVSAPGVSERRARELRHEDAETTEDSEPVMATTDDAEPRRPTAEPRHPTIVETAEELSIERAASAAIDPDEAQAKKSEEVSRSEEVSHRHRHKTVVLGTADPPPPSKDRPTRIL